MINKELKFIVDIGVSNKVEKWLAEQGFDVLSVRDIDPRLPDSEIVKIAAKENRMVITMDKDYGELVYRSNVNHTGVLLLRLDSYSSQEKVREALTEYLEARETEERPYELGQDLFGRFGSGAGDLSTTYKARIKEKLHEKSLD